MATAQDHRPQSVSSSTSRYRNLYQQAERFAASIQQNQPGPEVVSKVIQQVIESRSPKARYVVAIPFSGRLVLRMGDSFWDYALRRMFPIPPARSIDHE